MTISQAIRDYLTYINALGYAAATLTTYQYRFYHFRCFANQKGVKHVRDITISLVRSYHDELLRKKLGIKTRRSYLNIVQVFIKWAYGYKLMLSDISEQIELPQLDKKLPPKPLTQDEVGQLLALIKPNTLISKRNYAILELFYACGLRISELVGLNIGDIDFHTEVVFVRGKGDKDRQVPIHRTALKQIANYLEERGGKPQKRSPLFVAYSNRTKGETRLIKDAIYGIFGKLNKRFHKHVHPHLLRHTFAVHLLQAGVDIRHLQLLMGHESPETTGIYLGLVKDDLKREYDRAMEGILGFDN